eukprot:scaffold3651_cov230-Prasinococcus_capsulatus_cf.AAC.2
MVTNRCRWDPCASRASSSAPGLGGVRCERAPLARVWRGPNAWRRYPRDAMRSRRASLAATTSGLACPICSAFHVGARLGVLARHPGAAICLPARSLPSGPARVQKRGCRSPFLPGSWLWARATVLTRGPFSRASQTTTAPPTATLTQRRRALPRRPPGADNDEDAPHLARAPSAARRTRGSDGAKTRPATLVRSSGAGGPRQVGCSEPRSVRAVLQSGRAVVTGGAAAGAELSLPLEPLRREKPRETPPRGAEKATRRGPPAAARPRRRAPPWQSHQIRRVGQARPVTQSAPAPAPCAAAGHRIFASGGAMRARDAAICDAICSPGPPQRAPVGAAPANGRAGGRTRTPLRALAGPRRSWPAGQSSPRSAPQPRSARRGRRAGGGLGRRFTLLRAGPWRPRKMNNTSE